MTLTESFNLIPRLAARILPAPLVFLFTAEQPHGQNPSAPDSLWQSAMVQQTFTSGRPHFICSLLAELPRADVRFGGSAIDAYLGVPIVVRGRTVAVLGVFDFVPRQFGSGAHIQLEEVAQLAANLFEAADLVRLRELAFNKVSESEKLFRDSFDGAAVGIIHVSTRGRWLRVNPQVCEMLLFTEQELQTLSFLDLIHPDEIDLGTFHFNRLVVGEADRHHTEKRIRRKDGQYVWVSLSVAVSRRPDGRPGSFVVVIQDISARKETERTLLSVRNSLALEVAQKTNDLMQRNTALQQQMKQVIESEREQRLATERLQSIADAVPATICYWNRDLRLEFFNAVARGWFIGPDDSPIGKTMQELQGPELFRLNEPLVRAVLAGTPQHFERELVRADGSAAVADVQYWPDLDVQGVRGFYVMVSDITPMRAARDEAIKLAAAKGEFLANMSHEIRTPLNGVLGMTQLLLDTELTSEQRELVTISIFSGEHLLAIVNDILDFSKIESGNLTIEHVSFDVDELIAHCCTAFKRSAADKGLFLSVEPRLAGRQRLGDPTRLRQVLFNLIGNAIKFTSSGGVSLEVSLCDEGASVKFLVRDTGIGITPAQLPTLFERFTQADSSISRRFGGTGLGLAISFRLVRLMGGELCVSTQFGQGSCFWFSLPLAPSPVSSPELGHDQSLPGPGDFSGIRVLVAEDHPVNQLLVRRMLEGMGCDVTVAKNGREAVARWESAQFDVIFMDCQMPEMDGVEATKLIRRSNASGLAVPIIALTAGALQTDREQAMLAGMSDFLTKPIVARTLATSLRRALGGRTASAIARLVEMGSSDNSEQEQETTERIVGSS